MSNPNPPKPKPSIDHPYRAAGVSKKTKRAEYKSNQPALHAEYQRRYMERLTNGSKDRIQAALQQEAQTRRNIEALEDKGEDDE